MENYNLNYRMNRLLTDANFLLLKSLQSKSNLFETLAVSHTEMWHSAFVKWLIDPSSDLGLASFPLKRFLYMVAYHGNMTTRVSENFKLELANIENLQLDDMNFQNEFRYVDDGKSGRIDIIGANENVRIVIENKVKATEGEDQTSKYYEYINKSSENYQYDILLFLTPDEAQTPKSEHFITITYQDLCDFVIKPCIDNPTIKDESIFLLKQYLSNLGKPLKGGKVMALPNKDVCEKIYAAHKDVLDEIFLSVKGEAPQSISKTDKITTYNITLTQMLEKAIITIDDSLFAYYKGQHYVASLVNDNDVIRIQVGSEKHKSPSAAAAAITNTSINGWDFWKVRDKDNNQERTLGELRGNLNL